VVSIGLCARVHVSHYADALSHPLVGSIRNSLFYASVAVLIDLALGLMIGTSSCAQRVWGRGLLDNLSMRRWRCRDW
jgi:ABC-type Fe3+ transport system permease subunit